MNKMIARRLVGYMNEGYRYDAILTSTGNDNMAAGTVNESNAGLVGIIAAGIDSNRTTRNNFV